MKLNFPLKDARAPGSGLGFRNVSGGLQRNGKRGVGERVRGRKDDEGERGLDGFLELAGVAQGADEAVMGFEACGIGGDGQAEGLRGPPGRFLSEQIEAALRERRRTGEVVFGHGCE